MTRPPRSAPARYDGCALVLRRFGAPLAPMFWPPSGIAFGVPASSAAHGGYFGDCFSGDPSLAAHRRARLRTAFRSLRSILVERRDTLRLDSRRGNYSGRPTRLSPRVVRDVETRRLYRATRVR